MRAAPEAEAPSGAAAGFPWDEAMSAGFGLLRLSPETFWRMSPREFARALAFFAGERPEVPTRAAFEALARRFPDHPWRRE